MFKTFKKSISLIAAFLMLGSLSVKADITVASAGPMSGQYASFGAQLKAGAEMWAKDTNAKGGINGEKVKLVIGDDACDPKQAVAVANKFAGQGVVKGIEVYIELEGLIDKQVEIDRLTKEIGKLDKITLHNFRGILRMLDTFAHGI